MRFSRACVPVGGGWSTPFCRWQGSLSHLHPIPFAARVAARALRALGALGDGGVDPASIRSVVLGMTVPQWGSFYGTPWLAALLGAPRATGPTVSQACATGARVLATAAAEVEAGGADTVLALACDRTSNGPHLYYPDPGAPGGRGTTEDWVWDNFQRDPGAKGSMLETAERLARETGLSRTDQEELTLTRHAQYREALAGDGAFHRRFLVAPLEVPDAAGRKVVATLSGDEGIPATSREALARLAPSREGGTVTPGTQTRPADGNAGAIVATADRARALARGGLVARLLSYAEARVEPGQMPRATVPAARTALAEAGVSLRDVAAVKLHNPFAAGDLFFCREMGLEPERVNRFGSPLVWGHPQGPTGLRLALELIEELATRGGGVGLLSGCAAGDTAAALVLRVEEAR